jgi:hypothetical protein
LNPEWLPHPSAPETIADQHEGGRSLIFDGFNHAFAYSKKIMGWAIAVSMMKMEIPMRMQSLNG